jgi:L-fuculose-phosphate aldolase
MPGRKPDTKHAKLRRTIIDTCLQMNALGINQGTSGNVSARTSEGFLITPSGIPYERTKPKQIVAVDLEGGYRGDWLPSSEWRMHLDIYKARPEAQAVVHTHSVHATALAALRIEVPAFHYMIGVTGGPSLRCSDYATFGTEALSKTMLTALRDRTACLLANHGMICFGPSLEKALWLAGEIETLCQQYFIACQAGTPKILSAAEMKRVLARFKTYGKQSEELAEGDAPAVEAPVRRDTRKAASGGKETKRA